MSTSERIAEDPFAILGETLETAANAMETGEARARNSAHRAADATKRAVGSGAYSTSYGLAYGVVWIGTYLHDMMPPGGVVQRGFTDGAHDALAARILRLAVGEEKAAEHKEEPVPDADGEAAPPGAAVRHSPRARGAAARNGRASGKTRHAHDKMAGPFEDRA
jgi:hypothetical protein